ncbi:hypothetical protein C9374_011354 [Naegleria lovaniensis]|uniref:Uncharacterized protein n=1 Tax=Naegleria lovaniensis TaxID=51637 RepID=A0AA88H2U3_NAELO|nr:uncharacterized protein C9374_011354 [Naegleria lovaniensis]KAG2392629.1 hypothetical protein C9374_011354 [Naegleria lovaniensis]
MFKLSVVEFVPNSSKPKGTVVMKTRHTEQIQLHGNPFNGSFDFSDYLKLSNSTLAQQASTETSHSASKHNNILPKNINKISKPHNTKRKPNHFKVGVHCCLSQIDHSFSELPNHLTRDRAAFYSCSLSPLVTCSSSSSPRTIDSCLEPQEKSRRTLLRSNICSLFHKLNELNEIDQEEFIAGWNVTNSESLRLRSHSHHLGSRNNDDKDCPQTDKDDIVSTYETFPSILSYWSPPQSSEQLRSSPVSSSDHHGTITNGTLLVKPPETVNNNYTTTTISKRILHPTMIPNDPMESRTSNGTKSTTNPSKRTSILSIQELIN